MSSGSTERQPVTVKDLVEEAKKRIVFLIICVIGLSYLMSLTSSSVLVNLPAAASLIIILRYLSLDFDKRRKAASYKSKPASANIAAESSPFEGSRVIIQKSGWRQKVNSPVVEEAIDQFTRHIVSEWVTDLWYSRITPDKQGPEELVQIINGVLGEVSSRMKNINLIDFLTRDIINLLCTNLELFRSSKVKFEKQESRNLTFEERDLKLKAVLAMENKLHPALFSTEAEHKVLQHIMDGLISFTFKPEDLHCSLFRYIVRELLACTVMRPVINLANPRFINERIESLVISLSKGDKGSTVTQVSPPSKPNGYSKISSDHFTGSVDPSVKGVELVQLKKEQPRTDFENSKSENKNGTLTSKDPLLSIDTRSTRSWSSLPTESLDGDGGGIQRHRSGGDWGDMLDVLSRRKTEALAPEHFDNMWAKGRNYKRKEGPPNSADRIPQGSSGGISGSADRLKASSRQKENDGHSRNERASSVAGYNKSSATNKALLQSYKPMSYKEEDEDDGVQQEEVESGSTISDTTEDDEESSTVTGLDSPGVKVWDSKTKRNVSHIHHPLESAEGHKTRKTVKGRIRSQLSKTHSGRKRTRVSSKKGHIWQEGERTSFLLGDGQDILNSYKGSVKSDNSSDDSEAELFGRISSGTAASSSISLASLPENRSLTVDPPNNSLIAHSFLRLRCEVLGANIVKSGSRTFAVYSISVTDVNNNSWSIKRRFRHFEELHRRLKDFPEYNLHLPPKHFLSTGLDVPLIQERSELLDQYLKKLMQLPTISGSIEVWDFLSVDSQTYIFSNSLSIIETLPVGIDHAARKSKEYQHNVGPEINPSLSMRKRFTNESKESALHMKHDQVADVSRSNRKNVALSPPKKSVKEYSKAFEDSSSDSDNAVQSMVSSKENAVKRDNLKSSSDLITEAGTDPTIPSEWVPPNLSVPILDLVDVIFQLQDGGWIRRKAFWVAKQVLQLGMGDAFDDWLIEKIQLLRRGSVIASGIRKVEQILWPDGIFITKHPRRQRATPSPSPSFKSPHVQPLTPLSSPKIEGIQKFEDVQQKEADRRAKLVYELMIDKAPAAIVGLVGRKEYEQCAKDLYDFIQSSVALKQLAFDLVELLLLSAFPELDYVFKQLHEEKERFGMFKTN